jgi:hypothetical protein
MHENQKRMLAALRRVQSFLDGRAESLPGINDTGARQTIDEIVGELESLSLKQDPTKFQRRAELEQLKALRDGLRATWMRPIASIAATQLRNTPEYDKLRYPIQRTDDVMLAIEGREMAAAAGRHREVFTGAGMPADFDQTCVAAIAVFDRAVADRQLNNAMRVAVTGQLRAEARRGAHAIRVMDSLVRPLLANRDQLRAEWDSAKRVVLRSAPRGESETEVVVLPVSPTAPVQGEDQGFAKAA